MIREKSKLFIYFFFILFPLILNGQKTHEFESGIIKLYLSDSTLPKIVKDYYSGKIKISDDDRTMNLVKVITKKDDHFFPFYFYTFNRILNKSDGALSEMLPDYCVKVICNYPNETFIDFSQNDKDLKLYAFFLGCEFYILENMTIEYKMSYIQFQNYLNKNLNLQDETIRTVLKKFNVEIKRVIKSLY